MVSVAADSSKGLVPPPGYVFLADDDGALFLDWDGAYLITPI